MVDSSESQQAGDETNPLERLVASLVGSRGSDHWETPLTTILTLLLAGASLVVAGFQIDVGLEWFVPFIFAAQYLALRKVNRLQATAEDSLQANSALATELEGAGRNLVDLRERIDRVDVDVFVSLPQFYSAALEKASSATRNVRTTYFLDQPPQDGKGPAVREYFDGLLEWARSGSNRELQRVVCHVDEMGVRTDEHLSRWIREQVALAADRSNHYELRHTDQRPSFSTLNMCIIDEASTYILISGQHSEWFTGIGIHDNDITAKFLAHYSGLWKNADPFDDSVS